MDQPTRRLDLPNQETRTVCPECGGSMELVDLVGGLFTTHVSRGKNVFGVEIVNTNSTPCKARICVRCGFAKFYAASPQELFKE